MKNNGGQACKWCPDPAFRKQGRIWLCVKHYRFQTMRATAARHGKTVPDYDELQVLLPDGMICVGCRRAMVWTQAENKSTVITLQHDRDSSHRLICRACNTRHARMPGDSFYSLPPMHKRCPGCEDVLPYANFTKDETRFNDLKTYCRDCSNDRHKKWTAKNREHINRQQRNRRSATS